MKGVLRWAIPFKQQCQLSVGQHRRYLKNRTIAVFPYFDSVKVVAQEVGVKMLYNR